MTRVVSKSGRWGGIVVGGVLILVALFVGPAAVLAGVTIDGLRDAALQCTIAGDRPAAGGPYDEATVVTGERTFFPLGVTCGYNAPGDGYGPQQVRNDNWAATWVALACVVAFIAGTGLVVSASRRWRNRTATIS